jgi:hypothetical protein
MDRLYLIIHNAIPGFELPQSKRLYETKSSYGALFEGSGFKGRGERKR